VLCVWGRRGERMSWGGGGVSGWGGDCVLGVWG